MSRLNQDHLKKSRATNIGKIAYESLAVVRDGTIFGLTSRGTFIKTTNRFLNFLSFEGYRGPLTINFSPDDGSIPEIKVGMRVEISPNNLYIPKVGWNISLEEAEIWVPHAPAGNSASVEIRRARLVRLANRIIKAKFNSGLAPLLPRLLELDDSAEISDNDHPQQCNQILRLHQQMKSTDSFPATSSMVSLLGLGVGLTPSGDDFILGMLLVFNRWRDLFPNAQDLDRLNQAIVAAAYQKTTTLSANLIECAALGLGNERLIDTLDWIVNGGENETIPAEKLLSWGSSSGIDAFVGYAVAFSIR